MNPSRATLAMTGFLMCLHACTEQTVVPTEPSRAAPMPSIPGSSSATVRTGVDGDRFVHAIASDWAASGDNRLSRYLEEQGRLATRTTASVDQHPTRAAPSAPNLVIMEGEQPSTTTNEFPSPSTAPTAIIYYSSTAPFVSGSSGVVVSSVTYYGNIATTDVFYSVLTANGSAVLPNTKATNRGLGDKAPCIGSWLECSWTFKLQTVVSVSLGQECGLALKASANHRAEWTIPTFKLLQGSTWGTTFASNLPTTASNAACTQTPPTTVASGGGDASSPTSTGGTTTEPPSYQPGPFVPNGHWECVVYFMGTDYEKEYCTWYADNATRLATSGPSLTRLGAANDPSAARPAADLPSVFVIVSDQLPAGAMAVIERHREGPYRNVLLIPSGAIRPATLVAALQALADSRATQGETPVRELQLVLEGTVLDQHIPAAAREYAASFGALIARAKRADAGPYGTRQILEIRLADR
jgi:hypothetical protein